ncbi:MAG: PP2C family protein-serine/threonine phosphatase [Phycisphaeraceae bacterium]
MAHPSQLMIVADRRVPRDRLAGEARTLLEPWPARERPELAVVSLDTLLAEPDRLKAAGVVWLVLDQASQWELFELLGQVQERHIPAMLMRVGCDGPAGRLYDEGVVVCPPDASPATVTCLVRALWSQAGPLSDLQTETRTLRTQTGGLCGQIDRLDEELRLAAQLQREFLPADMPQIEGVNFHVLWRPASYVSGDIYDIIRLDEHHVGLFVADAVGHGVPAALLTMYIKRSLLTKQVDASLPGGYRLVEPSQTLAQLNRDLVLRQGERVRFTTACYGVLDCRSWQLTLARGGHPYPLLLAADGSTHTIESDGPVLGVFEDEAFEQTTIDLEPGDRLLLYSDGFELAFPHAAEPGKRAIAANADYAKAFEDLRQGPLEHAIQRLEQRLDDQAGSLNQRDDLTVVGMSIGDRVAAPAPPLARRMVESS